jgi:hypothetical protein
VFAQDENLADFEVVITREQISNSYRCYLCIPNRSDAINYIHIFIHKLATQYNYKCGEQEVRVDWIQTTPLVHAYIFNDCAHSFQIWAFPILLNA